MFSGCVSSGSVSTLLVERESRGQNVSRVVLLAGFARALQLAGKQQRTPQKVQLPPGLGSVDQLSTSFLASGAFAPHSPREHVDRPDG